MENGTVTHINGGDDRHEDHGREARKEPKERRMKAEHYAAILLTALLGGGQVKNLTSSSDLGSKIDAQGAEISKKFEAQTATLTALQLALTEIKARGDASDKVIERLAAELARTAQETRDLRDGMVRGATRQDEHERRITALEAKEGKK